MLPKFKKVIFILIIFTLVFIFNEIELNAYGNNWIEVEATSDGRQIWNYLSLKKNIDNTLIVESIFIPNFEGEIDELSYTMQINCKNKKFKDLEVNGIVNTSNDWLSANGDKLIDNLITSVCSYSN